MLLRFPILFLSLLLIFFSGCARYSVITEKDRGPDQPMDVAHIPDAVPRVEPRTRAGNYSPYTVLGKTYRVLENASGFKQRGRASWYGLKFHGKRTANGEIYNMYGMTAAHTTLPIPCYVRVTNMANGRQVIVRVNDRGPFHGNRIIDLTYTAAKKLGFEQQGTAEVELEVLDPKTYSNGPKASNNKVAKAESSGSLAKRAPTPKDSAGFQLPEQTYLQVGAYRAQTTAMAMRQRLLTLTHYPVRIRDNSVDRLYRVRIGPIGNHLDLVSLKQDLLEADIAEPHVVYGH